MHKSCEASMSSPKSEQMARKPFKSDAWRPSPRALDDLSLLSTSDYAAGGATLCSCFPYTGQRLNFSERSPAAGRKRLRCSQINSKPTDLPTAVTGTSVSKTVSLSDMDKVLMDFSQNEGKIISNPEKAESGLMGHHYTKEKLYVQSRSSGVRLPPYDLYMVEPWFHKGLQRDEAKELLQVDGLKEGAFLIRTSTHLPGCFILSLVHRNSVHHYPIVTTTQGSDKEMYFSLDGGSTRFKDLIQLVDFYEMNTGKVLPITLKSTVTRSA